MSDMAPLSASKEWKALEAHYESVKDLHLRALFADDPEAQRALQPGGRGPFP